MALVHRKRIFRKIEKLRGDRTLICYLNFDRHSDPQIPGLNTQLHQDVKEALYRVLKESVGPHPKIDLFLYTRGGDTNSVWPLVGLIREFDPQFQVLAPFRCHSAGTLLCLAATQIVLTPISELSPIDPTSIEKSSIDLPDRPPHRPSSSLRRLTRRSHDTMRKHHP